MGKRKGEAEKRHIHYVVEQNGTKLFIFKQKIRKNFYGHCVIKL